MMIYFRKIIRLQKELNFSFFEDQYQRFASGFEPAQNLTSGFF